ncbi:MAG: fibronectin type III domain-containing protein [Lachnospiraceae bacterium]|nr:fibronectin type III domain-containing protein [Lachnospiraceae bacterium]
MSWKTNTKGSGYEIQYSTASNFKKGCKNLLIKNARTSTKTISNLSKKKTYYFRIRTYKTNGKYKNYSAWSKTSKVKITK